MSVEDPPRQVALTLLGRRREVVLREPRVRREVPLHLPAGVGTGDPAMAARAVALMCAGYLETVDGHAPSLAELLEMVAEPASRRELLAARAAVIDAGRFAGRVFLGCPHCRASAVEVDLLGLAVALHEAPWPLTTPDLEAAVPSLATLRPHAPREPSRSTAGAVELGLPSARGTGARTPLGPFVTADRDAAGWRAWEQGDALVPGKEHWRYAHPGFRAILRAALLLERASPEEVEDMPVADFHFVDAVHHLLHTVPVTDAELASVSCPACARRFLVVR